MTQKRRPSLSANLKKLLKLEEDVKRGREEIAPKIGMPFVEIFDDTFTVRNAKEFAVAVHQVGIEKALRRLMQEVESGSQSAR